MHNLSRLEQSDKFGSTSVKMNEAHTWLGLCLSLRRHFTASCLTFVTIAVYWCLTAFNQIRPHSLLLTLKLNSNSKLQMALFLITKYQCSIILSDLNSAIHQKHVWQMVQSPAHFLCLEQLHNHRKCSRTEFCSSTVHNHLFLFWHSFVLNSVLKRTAQYPDWSE